MQLPIEGEIISHRPVIGKLIVAYKKFIRLLISPYLKTVFEKEHQIIEERFSNTLNEREERFSNTLNERFIVNTQDILKRTDVLFMTLDKRIENLIQREERIDEKLSDIKKQQHELENRLTEAIKRQQDLREQLLDITQEIILQKRRHDIFLSGIRDSTKPDDVSVKKIAEQKENILDQGK